MQLFTGEEYLKIDVANNFGLDKEDWVDRIRWFDKNESQLENLLKKAENPALYYASIQAYHEVMKGNPIGYPISLDATSSGFQILSCLTGDRSAAELCNVVNVGRRMDAYTAIYLDMLNQVGEHARIQRDDCKDAIMTSLYGSEATPKKVFGEGIMLRTFDTTMARRAPAVWELNKFWLDVWDPEAVEYSIIYPDNFHAHMKVTTMECEQVHFLGKPFDIFREVQGPTEKGRFLSANSTHGCDGMVVREMGRRCMYSPKQVQYVRDLLDGKQFQYKDTEENQDMTDTLWNLYKDTGYLSMRICDYLDNTSIHLVDEEDINAMLHSLPAKPFNILTVHDCFRCLPHYGNDLRRQYNLQLEMIAKSDLLSHMIKQITGQDIKVSKLDPTLWRDIADTDYALS